MIDLQVIVETSVSVQNTLVYRQNLRRIIQKPVVADEFSTSLGAPDGFLKKSEWTFVLFRQKFSNKVKKCKVTNNTVASFIAC